MKSFARHDALLAAVLPEHDEALVGDTLTSLTINFEWRKIIGAALSTYFVSDVAVHSEPDNDERLNALLNDLYT